MPRSCPDPGGAGARHVVSWFVRHRFTPIGSHTRRTRHGPATLETSGPAKDSQVSLKNRADNAKGRRTRRATADRQRVRAVACSRVPLVANCRVPASHRRRVPETRRAESRPCRGCGGLAEGEEPREAKPGVSERFRYLQSALTERSAEPDAGLEAGAAGRRLEI